MLLATRSFPGSCFRLVSDGGRANMPGMEWNVVDLLLVVVAAAGAGWGYRRGFASECYGTAALLVLVLTGSGLYVWVGRLVARVSSVAPFMWSFFASVSGILAGFFLMRTMRPRIEEWIRNWRPDPGWQAKAGAGLGALRLFIFGSFIVVWLSLLPLGPVQEFLGRDCATGRLLTRHVLPLYEKVSGERERQQARLEEEARREAEFRRGQEQRDTLSRRNQGTKR